MERKQFGQDLVFFGWNRDLNGDPAVYVRIPTAGGYYFTTMADLSRFLLHLYQTDVI